MAIHSTPPAAFMTVIPASMEHVTTTTPIRVLGYNTARCGCSMERDRTFKNTWCSRIACAAAEVVHALTSNDSADYSEDLSYAIEDDAMEDNYTEGDNDSYDQSSDVSKDRSSCNNNTDFFGPWFHAHQPKWLLFMHHQRQWLKLWLNEWRCHKQSFVKGMGSATSPSVSDACCFETFVQCQFKKNFSSSTKQEVVKVIFSTWLLHWRVASGWLSFPSCPSLLISDTKTKMEQVNEDYGSVEVHHMDKLPSDDNYTLSHILNRITLNRENETGTYFYLLDKHWIGINCINPNKQRTCTE